MPHMKKQTKWNLLENTNFNMLFKQKTILEDALSTETIPKECSIKDIVIFLDELIEDATNNNLFTYPKSEVEMRLIMQEPNSFFVAHIVTCQDGNISYNLHAKDESKEKVVKSIRTLVETMKETGNVLASDGWLQGAIIENRDCGVKIFIDVDNFIQMDIEKVSNLKKTA